MASISLSLLSLYRLVSWVDASLASVAFLSSPPANMVEPLEMFPIQEAAVWFFPRPPLLVRRVVPEQHVLEPGEPDQWRVQ